MFYYYNNTEETYDVEKFTLISSHQHYQQSQPLMLYQYQLRPPQGQASTTVGATSKIVNYC